MESKRAYVTPKLTVHGDMVEVTKGTSTGQFTDRDFPDGTPRGELTFSDQPLGE